ncbi:MAG: hypothetical protein WCT01_03275 [Candidatus Shapirobacteria bacterium]|jgi:hypothetical protein
MSGKTLKPEYAGLVRAAVAIDRAYGGNGRFMRPIIRIAKNDLPLFLGMDEQVAKNVLSLALDQLAEVRLAGEDYKDPNMVVEVLEWAAQMPEQRK